MDQWEKSFLFLMCFVLMIIATYLLNSLEKKQHLKDRLPCSKCYGEMGETTVWRGQRWHLKKIICCLKLWEVMLTLARSELTILLLNDTNLHKVSFASWFSKNWLMLLQSWPRSWTLPEKPYFIAHFHQEKSHIKCLTV